MGGAGTLGTFMALCLITAKLMASAYVEGLVESLQTLPGEMRRNMALLHDLDIQSLGST
jgi:hypothetical protein